MDHEELPPGYVVRERELKALFTDLSVDDALICSYNCLFKNDGWHKGRLYVTKKSICVSANGQLQGKVCVIDVDAEDF